MGKMPLQLFLVHMVGTGISITRNLEIAVVSGMLLFLATTINRRRILQNIATLI